MEHIVNVKVDVVVASAGVGKRMGSNIPKQYIKLKDKTILEWTIFKLLLCPYINNIIVVISKEDPFFKELPISKNDRIKVAFGGKERFNSVFNGLQEVGTKWVMVHDAARPFVQLDDLKNLVESCVNNNCGAILSCRVADTIKEGSDSSIVKTVSRDKLYRAFTPQMFKTTELKEALSYCLEHNIAVTDEASAMESLQKKVMLIESDPINFKITTPGDLKIAKAFIESEDY